MLVLPTKKADAYDTTKPLSTFLAKEYPNEAAKYTESLTAFQTVRNNAVFVNGSSGQLGFHNILRYNYHMSSISKRLSGMKVKLSLVSHGWILFNPANEFKPEVYITIGRVFCGTLPL